MAVPVRFRGLSRSVRGASGLRAPSAGQYHRNSMLDGSDAGADSTMAVPIYFHRLPDGGICSHPDVVGIAVAAVAVRMGVSTDAAPDMADKPASHRQMAGRCAGRRPHIGTG